MPDLWDAHRRRTPVPVAHPGPAQVFRRKFCDGLERLYGKGLLELSDPSAQLQHREQFTALMDQLRHKKKWIVYTKPPFGGPAHVLRYLGRYTHRIAISNHRLLGFDGEQVTLRWRDSAHGNKQRAMTLDATEFLRRFFLHVLPKGFVRIRHYGLLSNAFDNGAWSWHENCWPANNEIRFRRSNASAGSTQLWHCPRCGDPMHVARRLTAPDLSLSRDPDSS